MTDETAAGLLPDDDAAELPDAAEMLAPELWLWLANALGFGAETRAVLEAWGTPRALHEALHEVDLSAQFTPGQARALLETQPEDFTARVHDCARLGVQILCYDDPDYPPLLRQISSAPPVLYARGQVGYAAHTRLPFAFVGTRRPSSYGVEALRALARPLAQSGAVLVSGLAAGLDSEAHKAALAVNAPTVACIAFGHDKCYPAAHAALKGVIERQGLVLSEYPPGTEPQRQFFLQRNRIIAGISRGVCVAEARLGSGTMNTVSWALSFDRDVFSVPGSILSPLCEGTNRLLAEGAVPALSAESILAYYGLGPKQLPPDTPAARAEALRRARPARADEAKHARREAATPLSPEAQQVRAALTAVPQSAAALAAATGLAQNAVMASLTELELAGIASQQAGRQFLLV